MSARGVVSPPPASISPPVHQHNTNSNPTSPDAAEDRSTTPTIGMTRPRGLSAAAKEFTPESMSHPSVPTSPSPPLAHAHQDSQDYLQQIDDAEDEDELQAFCDSAMSSSITDASGRAQRDPAMITVAVRRQVEFYLSNQNLWKDAFLQEEMKKDPNNFVPLTSLLSLKRIACLTTDKSVMVNALKQSEKLLLNNDATAVRRIHPLQAYDQYKDSNRTIFVDRLPPHSTVKSVKQMFSRFGKVSYVLRADHMLGATGLNIEEKGKLTPQPSPKVKPRSLSNSDVGARPNLSALHSPSLGPLSGDALAFLSPAQRNRAIAASSPSLDPECFSAAFIQFEKPAFCKKAISSIVAFNKQLKAMTPKGSPRVSIPKGSGVPILPPGAIGASSHTTESTATTPPRSRSVRINSLTGSSPTIGSPLQTALSHASASSTVSPPRQRVVNFGEGHATSPPSRDLHSDLLPPTHPVNSFSPPLTSGMPRYNALSPSEKAVRERRAQSVSSPPPAALSGASSRKMSTGGESPPFSPLSSPHANAAPFQDGKSGAHDGVPPELSLHDNATSPLSMLQAHNPVVVLTETFIGLFVMPKISYLKSLAVKHLNNHNKPAEKKTSPTVDGSGVSSPTDEKEHKEHLKDAPVKEEREKASSPPALTQAHTTASANNSASAAAHPAHEKKMSLNASAKEFTPMPTPKLTPLLAPAAVKPLTAPTTSPNSIRAMKGNWRSDGSTPLLGPSSLSSPSLHGSSALNSGAPEFEPNFSNFALGASATSPSLDENGNPIPAHARKAGKKVRINADGSVTETDSARNSIISERPKFTLTNKRPSLHGSGAAAGPGEEGVVRQIVSRFALGPSSAEAIGFAAGRGRGLIGAGTPLLAPAGGGRPL